MHKPDDTFAIWSRAARAVTLLTLLLTLSTAMLAQSTFVVNSTGDEPDADTGDAICQTSNGACTLRAAIQQANATTGPDSIHFAIPDTALGYNATDGFWTIAPATIPPAITDTVVLDATTQPGTDCATMTRTVVFDGINLSNGSGIKLASGSATSLVRGLAIHSFPDRGVHVSESDHSRLQCLLIGTDPTGTPGLGNGIEVTNADSVVIGTDGDGTDDALEGNVVVGNNSLGIWIRNNSNGFVVAGNHIGVLPDETPLGNQRGILVDGVGPGRIGGITPNEANEIAYNGQGGIRISGSAADGNRILGNSIYDNGRIGIDLGGFFTPNDPGDPDEGANQEQNFPELTSVELDGGDLTLTYLVDSTPTNAAYPIRVEVFLADSSGEQGQTFLGALDYTVGDAQSEVTQTFTPLVAVNLGDVLVTTATDTDGNTSEFSLPTFLPRDPFIVNSTGDDADADTSDDLCQTSGGACTLRAAIEQANAIVGPNTIHFNMPTSDGGYNASEDVWTITPTSPLPDITSPLTLDAVTQHSASCLFKRLKIELDGAQAGLDAVGLRFGSGSEDSSVRGLAIYRFSTGISVELEGNGGHHIACNLIGTDVARNTGLGNGRDGGQGGIYLNDAFGTIIGADRDGINNFDEGNVIVGNTPNGITVDSSFDLLIARNHIGVLLDDTPLGNTANGIVLNATALVTVGGVESQAVNEIAYNGAAGVLITGSPSDDGPLSGNPILRNEIYANGGLGIDLSETTAPDGLTPNDEDDPDTGPNQLQNTPELTSASLSGDDLTLTYSIDSDPANAAYPIRVEVFQADADDEEGRRFLGALEYTEDDAQQEVTQTFAPNGSLFSERIVTTATDDFGNTSEFSASIPVAGAVLRLTANLWLEGPFTGTDMNTDLSAVLPETDPYFNFESVPDDFFTSDPNGQRVVDWLWLELRIGDPASPPMQIAMVTPALLLDDGSVTALDAVSPISFFNLEQDSFYLVAKHRNHLAVMSDSLLDCSSGSCTHDFRSSQSAAYGSTPMADLGGGAFGLYAGDANASGQVQNDDKNIWWNTQAGQAGYLEADFNLNAQVQNDDKNLLWNLNAGRGTQVPEAEEDPLRPNASPLAGTNQ